MHGSALSFRTRDVGSSLYLGVAIRFPVNYMNRKSAVITTSPAATKQFFFLQYI
jgi:hypothetical protein